MRGQTWLFASLVLFGCGDDGGAKPDAPMATPDAPPDAPVETLGAAPALAQACTDSKADVYTLPSGLPAMSDMHRGDVIRCAVTESLSTYKVNAQIDAYNQTYMHTVAGHATSGFWSWRIAYRTQRNTVSAVRAEGESGAVLLVPEHPLANAPLVVFGHGSVGIGAQCAPSHLDLSGAVADEDYPPILLRLAGAGFTVIAPDYAGFSYGQAPGYFQAEDEAHSILDASRAAKKILGTAPTNVVFVGHSQGGHAVLAAQSYAAAYGHYGTLVGVAAMAPLWTSLSLFGAAVTSTGNLMTANAGDVSAIFYAMEYAYSEGELRDGAGHGVDVFATAKQAAAKDAMLSTTSCYDVTKLQALGAKPMDFFDANYVNIVGSGCALGATCTDPLAAKWKANWIAERPPIDPAGAPILAMFGGMDTFIAPPRAKCGLDKWAADIGAGTATVTSCYTADTAHRDFPRTADADYLIKWISFKGGIGSDPGACGTQPLASCPPIPQNY